MNLDNISYLACSVGLRHAAHGLGDRKVISTATARKRLKTPEEIKLFDLWLVHYDLLREGNGCMRRPRKDTPQVRAINAAEEAAEAYAATLVARPLTVKTLEPYTYYAFKAKDDRLILLYVSRDGKVSLTDGGDYEAASLTKIDEFRGVDSISDYQHSLTNVLLGHKLTKCPSYKAAKRIAREGL